MKRSAAVIVLAFDWKFATEMLQRFWEVSQFAARHLFAGVGGTHSPLRVMVSGGHWGRQAPLWRYGLGSAHWHWVALMVFAVAGVAPGPQLKTKRVSPKRGMAAKAKR